jgi:N4-gp56 family major capsid protein
MRLLTAAVANFPHAHVAQLGSTPKETIPDQNGDVIHGRKFSELAAATTPLNEGETPEPTEVSVEAVTATVAEYGAYLRYTRMLMKKAIDKHKTVYAGLLGRQVGKTIDTLTRDVAVTTTNVLYPTGCTGRSDITTSHVLSSYLVRKAIRQLQAADAEPLVGDRYIGIMHPNAYFDFQQDSTIMNAMLQVFDKGDGNPLVASYIGTVLNVDWYQTTNAKIYSGEGSGGSDVYATLIFGKDALGIGGLAGMMPGAITASQRDPNTGKTIMPVALYDTPPDTPSKDDPLRQRGTLGWNTTFVAKILDNDRMIKIEHGATA